MNLKIKLLILGIVALIAVSGCLQSQIQLDPPMATLTIVKSNYGINNSQGFGSYCVKEIWIGPCKDNIGILTLQEPLPVGSPFTVHLLLPLQETPEELQLNVIRVTSEDKLKGGEENAWQLWRFQEGKRLMLPLEREQDIELSLEPGLYVLKIGAGWKEKGSVSYGFLIEVRANGTDAVSIKVQGAKITGDIGVSIGYSGENQTDSQKISWTVSIANIGVKTAKNVTAYVILPPGIVSRLDALEESTVLGDLESEVQAGFKGNATFNASGLSKQDIMAWEPLVKIKVTWTEDGIVNEKILPDEVSK